MAPTMRAFPPAGWTTTLELPTSSARRRHPAAAGFQDGDTRLSASEATAALVVHALAFGTLPVPTTVHHGDPLTQRPVSR
jgi:hypothetical protein